MSIWHDFFGLAYPDADHADHDDADSHLIAEAATGAWRRAIAFLRRFI